MAYKYYTHKDARNFTPGPNVQATFGYPRVITNITLHWWGLPEWKQTTQQVVSFFCDSATVGTSAHEVISAGEVWCIVDHSAAAWANGNAKGNAQSITLECNPRMSAADMDTVAERIADIWKSYGRIIPLTEHREWFATQCPGTYDKNTIYARAMQFYQGAKSAPAVIEQVAQEIKSTGGKMSDEKANQIISRLDQLIFLFTPGKANVRPAGEPFLIAYNTEQQIRETNRKLDELIRLQKEGK